MGTLIINPYLNKLWTPTEITTELWLDAADDSTITIVDNKVSEWVNKSNNTALIQANTLARPIIDATNLNNKQSLSFNLTDFFTATLAATSTIQVFIVAMQRTLGTSNLGQMFDFSYNETNRGLRGFENSGGALYWLNNLSQIVNTSVNPFTTSPYLFNLIHDGSSLFWSKNGAITLGSSLNSWLGSSGVADAVNIGRGFSSARGYDGLIGEFIVLHTIVSQSDRQKLEGYLAHKWGLTANLPVTHPYKNTPPYVYV